MTPTHPQIKGDARCALQHCWYMLLDITLAGGVLNKGIVKTTTPFVNATTLVICSHVIWDFTRDVGVS